VIRDPSSTAAVHGLFEFEVDLQFDSLRREALHDLRGADLRGVREQAPERLNALAAPPHGE
jgi:hypothetical protein